MKTRALSGTSLKTPDAVERSQKPYSPYRVFTREEWARLRADTPMTLLPHELEQLSGIIEEVSVDEVEQIYLPLSRLLNLYVAAAQKLHSVSSEFLGRKDTKVPFVIGVAGSVAVGKSTTARVLKALLARWPDHPRVDAKSTRLERDRASISRPQPTRARPPGRASRLYLGISGGAGGLQYARQAPRAAQHH